MKKKIIAKSFIPKLSILQLFSLIETCYIVHQNASKSTQETTNCKCKHPTTFDYSQKNFQRIEGIYFRNPLGIDNLLQASQFLCKERHILY